MAEGLIRTQPCFVEQIYRRAVMPIVNTSEGNKVFYKNLIKVVTPKNIIIWIKQSGLWGGEETRDV